MSFTASKKVCRASRRISDSTAFGGSRVFQEPKEADSGSLAHNIRRYIVTPSVTAKAIPLLARKKAERPFAAPPSATRLRVAEGGAAKGRSAFLRANKGIAFAVTEGVTM